MEAFAAYMREKDLPLFMISAATNTGLAPLLSEISHQLAQLPPIRRYEPEHIAATDISPREKNQEFTIRVEDGVYIVEGSWLRQSLGFVDLDDYEGLQYLQRVLKSSGILNKLEEMGIKEGDTVSILDIEFDYVP